MTSFRKLCHTPPGVTIYVLLYYHLHVTVVKCKVNGNTNVNEFLPYGRKK